MTGVVSAMTKGLVWLIRGYRAALTPFFGPSCRFEPSCSRYAEEALASHGLRRGVVLAAVRLCRCHPFGSSGLDPVPEPRATAARALG